MRYVALLLIIFTVASASCTKYEHYSCFCKVKGVDTSWDDLVIGKASKEEAYAKCRAFRDTSKYDCVMQILK